MTIHSEFSKFVQAQHERNKKESDFDPKAELHFWLKSLHGLYERVEHYLSEFTKSGAALIRYEDIELNEDFCGTYSARKLLLSIGPQHYSFTPKGTMLIGSRGRVDVLGPAGLAMLGLVDKSMKGVTVRVRTYLHGQPRPKDGEPQRSVEWEWKIITRVPRPQYEELTQATFETMLLSISNG